MADAGYCIFNGNYSCATQGPTVGVTSAGAGLDSVWEQEKLEVSLSRRFRPGKNARKRHRISSVQCALCWAVVLWMSCRYMHCSQIPDGIQLNPIDF